MLTFKISDILVDSGKACVICTNFGEYKGEEYSNRGVTFVKFSDKKYPF